MAITLEMIGLSHPGKIRVHNEDALCYDEQLGIAVLADGMGGHNAGEVASKLAVDTIADSLRSNLKTLKANAHEAASGLSDAISKANSLIWDSGQTDSSRKSMGTTVVTVVVDELTAYIGHVGDSRLYLLRGELLRRVTKDHSLIEELVDKGMYTEKEARTASVRHVVTKALGTSAEVEPETGCCCLEAGDILLLCSDGLSDMVPDETILYTLLTYPSNLHQRAKRLIEMANHRGGKDNVSVLLIQVHQ